jgi:hypothetical protein
MDKIRAVHKEVNEKIEKYKDCEEIVPPLKSFNDECEKFMKEECKVAVPQATCNLTESELTATNASLRNLQMKINVKKKDGQPTGDEQREFQSIKNGMNPKLTPECRKRFSALIEAYTNYCKVIEGLF